MTRERLRLQRSRAAADEVLTSLLNRGYAIQSALVTEYRAIVEATGFEDLRDMPGLRAKVDHWGAEVIATLAEIFPTELEQHLFARRKSRMAVSYTGISQQFGELQSRVEELLDSLREVLVTHLPRYTDLPAALRLHVEDIDSFRKVRDVNPSQVTHLLSTAGYLDLSENEVQSALEQILDVSMHKKDWGGETNDLYTANVVVNGARVASAFLLKGNGLRKPTMEIADCGKNGDQLVRLLDSPAQLYFVQFVGNVSENVIRDIDGKIRELVGRGLKAHYCIMNGQDTARVLLAYGKLSPTSMTA